MTLAFAPATKAALKARVALDGPSGSGKTYTALITARALAGPAGKIAVIDTERRSASLYADRFAFDTLALDTYDPRLLIEALALAGSSGYDVVVVDSLSHFWEGVDGMLEQADKAAKRSPTGNTFTAWKDVRPVERRMIDAMLALPGHLVVTMRTKTEWVLETNDRGKQVPRKVGTKPVQREGIEYEFTVVGDLDTDHNLVVSKSRCPNLADQVIARPDESFGKTLLEWLNDGAMPVTAAQIRDELLANPAAGLDDYRAAHGKAKAGGLLGTAIVDEVGETTTLGEWLIARGHAAKAGSPA